MVANTHRQVIAKEEPFEITEAKIEAAKFVKKYFKKVQEDLDGVPPSKPGGNLTNHAGIGYNSIMAACLLLQGN